ncbi:type 1 glutamine amidotransferase [Rhodococcus sp. ABRD24]|uniref:type 1 glutamine amidotransferase n=1 Tax=Rhodococcus sp. ABRD24 TaxID=2507582 RepID=UPI001A95621D|nr:type 1 glutamine amidotransferase [Rhodococcus sp. ABRD24]
MIIEMVCPFNGDPVPSRLDADGLIVLGGDMSSLDDAKYSWLEDIRSLVRSVATDSRPALGICLGGQLMAQALGGETAVGDHGLETGVASVQWRPAATDDPIFCDLPNPFTVGTMHRDAISVLPPGAVWLGESTPYPHQAFRVADNMWGIQFHPEADHRQYELWAEAIGGPNNPAWQQIQDGAHAFALAEGSIALHCKKIAIRFAGIVHVDTRAKSRA